MTSAARKSPYSISLTAVTPEPSRTLVLTMGPQTWQDAVRKGPSLESILHHLETRLRHFPMRQRTPHLTAPPAGVEPA